MLKSQKTHKLDRSQDIVNNKIKSCFRKSLRASFLAGVGAGAFVLGVMGYHSPLMAEPLSEGLERMLYEHPQLVNSRRVVMASASSIDEAESGYFPTISIGGEHGYERVSNTTNREQDLLDFIEYQSATVDIRQNIFNGLETMNNVKSGNLAFEAAKYDYFRQVQTRLSDTIQAYIEVMRVQELLALNERRQDTIRSLTELEDERVRRGAGVAMDVLQAKTRLQRAIEERYNFDRQLARAIANLEESMGFLPDLEQMEDDISGQLLVPASLEQAKQIGLDGNPGIRKAVLDAESSQSQMKSGRAGYLPTVDLVGSNEWTFDAGAAEGERVSTTSGYVEVSWDLFSGFATKAAVERLAQTWKAALSEIDQNRLSVGESIHTNWASLENANRRHALYKEGIILAQEMIDTRTKLKDSGKDTMIGVLDAQNELFRTENNVINAKYDAKVAAVDLAGSIGILTPESIGLTTPEPMEEGQFAWNQTDTEEYMPSAILDEQTEMLPEETESLVPEMVEEEGLEPIPQAEENTNPASDGSFDESQLPVQPLEYDVVDQGDGAATLVPELERGQT